MDVMTSREVVNHGGEVGGYLGSSLEGFQSMIQKNSGSLRKTTMRSNAGSSLGQSPTLRSTSSISSLRKSFLRSSSISTSGSSRSASPTRSCSSQMGPLGQKIRIVRSSSNESPCRRRQDSYAGNISVVIRPKPVANAERDLWHIENQTMISHEEAGEFSFDHVFSADCGNVEVYERTSRPMIDKLLEGFNATVFAYGMTGSGKTFTMTGTKEDPGLIPLSISYLFSKIMEQSGRGLKTYEVVVSYLEIYNEKIYDLLDCDIDIKSPTTPARTFLANKPRTFGGPVELRIRDDAQYGVRIVGLTEKMCESGEEISRWIEIGDKNRRTSETIYNTRSSRSHAVVLIRVNNTDLSSGTTTSTTLSLCDLAGSERAVSEYERRKEGAYINKSLLALGTVISKLSAESLNNSGSNVSNLSGPMNTHIPYRDSKLTRLLQPALSGNSIITTICTIDTRSEAANETINTMRFASRAKNVTLFVAKRRNICSGTDDEKDHLIESLTEQLEVQQQHVVRLEQRLCAVSALEADGSAVSNSDMSRLRIENQFLKDRLNHCEQLLNKDTVELQDSEMVTIIDLLPVEVGNLLEAKFQNFESQLREYKNYTRQLELKVMARGNEENRVALPKNKLSGEDDLIQIKQSEVTELRKTLERKDKLIDALQSAKRLRQRVLQPIENKEENYEPKRTGRFY